MKNATLDKPANKDFPMSDVITCVHTKLVGNLSNGLLNHPLSSFDIFFYQISVMGSGSFELKIHTDWRTTRRGFRIAYCAGCYNWNAVSAMCGNRRSRSSNRGRWGGYFPSSENEIMNGLFGNGWPNITHYNHSQPWGWNNQ